MSLLSLKNASLAYWAKFNENEKTPSGNNNHRCYSRCAVTLTITIIRLHERNHPAVSFHNRKIFNKFDFFHQSCVGKPFLG